MVPQPKLYIDGQRPSGAEVWLRWHGLELGDVSPSQFIALTERRGHRARIGDWVLERAFRAAATRLETDPRAHEVIERGNSRVAGRNRCAAPRLDRQC